MKYFIPALVMALQFTSSTPSTAQSVSDSTRIVQLMQSRDSLQRLVSTATSARESALAAIRLLESDTSQAARLQVAMRRAEVDSLDKTIGAWQAEGSQMNAQMAELGLRERQRLSIALASETQASERQRLQAQLDLTEADKRRVVFAEKTRLVSNVGNWMVLGGAIASVSLTAQSLLLFPEGDSGWWDKARGGLQWIGTIASIGGAYLASQGESSTGTPIATGGLLLSTALQRFATRDTVLREMASRVARNRAFTDDVNSLAKLTPGFAREAAALNNDIAVMPADSIPTEAQLNQYYRLLSQQRELFALVNQIRAKADLFLGEFGPIMQEKARTQLRSLINESSQAVRTWQAYEPVYLQPYEFLRKERRGY